MRGNVIVGQSGGPTCVINASLAGVFRMAVESGAQKVYGMLYGIQGLLKEEYIDLSEHIQNNLDEQLLQLTPSSFLGSCRYKLPKIQGNEEVYERIFSILKKLDIEVFVYIGGNDSMDTIQQLTDYAATIGDNSIKFIGCPKTIDNDLLLTDHTPGFGSAAKFIATTMKEMVRDSNCIIYPNGLVTVVEIMGRNAGWLTGAAALCEGEDCAGPDLIYLPEIPFDLGDFLKRVEKLREHKFSVVVAVSEGIKTADGKYVCEYGMGTNYTDAFGHKQLSGTADFLCNVISEKFKCKTRAIELSVLQRCAAHISSRQDIMEAYRCGVSAVKAAVDGNTGVMVILDRVSNDPYMSLTALRDVHKIANGERTVPLEWIQDKTYVTEEFINYVRPLIQGEEMMVFVNGLPRHVYDPCRHA